MTISDAAPVSRGETMPASILRAATTLVLAVACALVTVAPLAVAGELAVYHNARFGYSIGYPLEFFPQGESENADGQRFLSPDGAAVLMVWAGFNVLETPLHKEYKSALTDRHREVTYEVMQDNWFVVSGYEGGRIFYRKTVLGRGGDAYFSFELLYPRERRLEFDPLVKPVADSFRVE